MADVKKAVDAVLREEDATLSGVITNTKGDRGGKTRFGLASKYHPELLATTYYTTMPVEDALKLAILKLTDEYAAPLRIADLEDQALATKLLSFGVNAGVPTASGAFQYAVNCVFPGAGLSSPALLIDGVIGPQTLAEANRCMEQSLLNSFRLRMIGYYNADAIRHPSQLEFLCGWIDRALA